MFWEGCGIRLCVCVCLSVYRTQLIVGYAQTVTVSVFHKKTMVVRDIMNITGHKNHIIGSKVTVYLITQIWFLRNNFSFEFYYFHLQKSKVKAINNKMIP